MIYECDGCNKALPPGVFSCPRCGEAFEEAVPADAEVPKRGFSAQPRTPGAENLEQFKSRDYNLAALGQHLSPNKPKQGEMRSGETEVLVITGKGDKKSKPFTVGERWRIEWKAVDDEAKYKGTLHIYVNTVKDKSQVTSLGGSDGSQKDSSEEYGAGYYYIEVSSCLNSWTIRVIDYG